MRSPRSSFHFEASRDGAHGEHGSSRFVVDIDGCLAELRDAFLQAVVLIVFGDFAGAQSPRVHARLRREHTIDELFGGHFEREDADGGLVFDRRFGARCRARAPSYPSRDAPRE